ncbi:uncharacterized protein [Pseudorasbora parva]|uniref:uncharacterized protein n=1 Tax=Pseudorasbora parva TaxID=51549 RepID=UPI00351DBCC8
MPQPPMMQPPMMQPPMLKPSYEIHNSYNMTYEMQREAVQAALLAVNTYTTDMDIATYIVQEFNRKYWWNWQCIVGNSSGCSIYNYYLNFSVGDRRIMMWRP